VGILGERVFRKTILFELLAVGNALQPDGITGITDKAEVVGINPDVKQFVQFVGQFTIETESFNEIFAAIHTLPQHFLPEFHWYLFPPIK
jgi:hypothetical protein